MILFGTNLLLLVLVIIFDKADSEEDWNKQFESAFSPEGSQKMADFFKDQGLLSLSDKLENPSSASLSDNSAINNTAIAEKKKNQVPLAAKIFFFFGKTYQCTMSKINEEFWNLYKSEMIPCPKEENGTDTSWLKMNNSTSMVDGSAIVTVEEGNQRFAKLTPEQRQVLEEGLAMMPICPQIYIRFVRSQGCQDTKLEDYKKYNILWGEALEKLNKKPGKKYNAAFYNFKAEEILDQNF